MWLTNYVGDLLITDAGEATPQAKLFVVRWDAAITNFVTRGISLPSSIGGRFEHVTFAPLSQGTFVFDQQSSDEGHPAEAIAAIQANQPIG